MYLNYCSAEEDERQTVGNSSRHDPRLPALAVMTWPTFGREERRVESII
jgi:hypothetical protein